MSENKLNTALVGSFGLFCLSLIMLVASATYYYLLPEKEGMGNYTSPRQVIGAQTDRYPGIEGPVVIQGGTLTTEGFRCIYGDHALVVTVSHTFQPIKPDGAPDPLRRAVPGERDTDDRKPGCFEETIELKEIPTGVGPGLWKLEVAEAAIEAGTIRYWNTEPFTVIVGPE